MTLNNKNEKYLTMRKESSSIYIYVDPMVFIDEIKVARCSM